MTRAHRYGRVSTTGQNDQGAASIPDQDRITGEYVARKGWEDAGFTHDEQTGTNTARPEWRGIVDRSKRGDAIVVHKVDRFARSLHAGVNEIARLAELGVDIVIVDPELDTTTPFGRAFRSMLLVFAELDREMILGRLASGQYGAARQGRWPSSAASVPFGYMKVGTGANRDSHLELHAAEAATIREAARLVVDGRTIQQTCDLLNAQGMLPRKAVEWDSRLLRAMLSETARYGKIWWGRPGNSASGKYGKPVLIEAPPVLTQGEWDLVQAALAATARPDRAADRPYPLSLRLTSPCGDLMTGISRNDLGYAQYRCRGTKWTPGGKSCGCRRLRADEVEHRVWAEVVALLSAPRLHGLAAHMARMEIDATTSAGRLEQLDKSMTKLQERKDTTIAGWIRAGRDVAELAGAMTQLDQEIATMSMLRDELARQVADADEGQRRLDALELLAAGPQDRLSQMGPAEQAEIIALLDVRVTVLDRGKVPSLRIEGVMSDDALCNPAPRRLRLG